jgi:hypothetical protein
MDMAVSQEQLDRLAEDAAYMQDEAEALKYVIDQVPCQEHPPGERSIAEILLFIDYAQRRYFRSALEEAVENPRPTHIDKLSDFEDTFEPDRKRIDDIQTLLNDVAKHRAAVINTIKNISLIDWDKEVYINNREILLIDFIGQMIRFDHIQLKKIADLVRTYSEQKQNERRIRQQQSMQNSPSNHSG